MTEFTANPSRLDPYKNFKFRVKWDGKYVAGVSEVSALKRTTEVIEHRKVAIQVQSENRPAGRRSSQLLWSEVRHTIMLSKSGPTLCGSEGR